MELFIMPADRAEALESLTGIEAVVTAKEWRRAAIVTMLATTGRQANGPEAGVSPGSRGYCRACREGRLHGTDELAAHGIAGLRNADTVRRYIERWTGHGEGQAGRPRPAFGESVNMEGLPLWRQEYDRGHTVLNNPQVVAEALADPTFRQKVLNRAPRATREALHGDALASLPSVAREEDIAGARGRREEDIAGARGRREDEANARGGARYVEMELALASARRHLNLVVTMARNVELDAEHVELISDSLGRLRGLLGLAEMAIAGVVSVDWDAELAKLGGAS